MGWIAEYQHIADVREMVSGLEELAHFGAVIAQCGYTESINMLEIERLRTLLRDRPRDDGTVVAVGGEPGASAGSSE